MLTWTALTDAEMKDRELDVTYDSVEAARAGETDLYIGIDTAGATWTATLLYQEPGVLGGLKHLAGFHFAYVPLGDDLSSLAKSRALLTDDERPLYGHLPLEEQVRLAEARTVKTLKRMAEAVGPAGALAPNTRRYLEPIAYAAPPLVWVPAAGGTEQARLASGQVVRLSASETLVHVAPFVAGDLAWGRPFVSIAVVQGDVARATADAKAAVDFLLSRPEFRSWRQFVNTAASGVRPVFKKYGPTPLEEADFAAAPELKAPPACQSLDATPGLVTQYNDGEVFYQRAPGVHY